MWLQGVTSALFNFFFGYPGGFPAVGQPDGAILVSSPQVLETARDFFGCQSLFGVELENAGGAGTRNAHWEERVFDVRLLPDVRCRLPARPDAAVSAETSKPAPARAPSSDLSVSAKHAQQVHTLRPTLCQRQRLSFCSAACLPLGRSVQ